MGEDRLFLSVHRGCGGSGVCVCVCARARPCACVRACVRVCHNFTVKVVGLCVCSGRVCVRALTPARLACVNTCAFTGCKAWIFLFKVAVNRFRSSSNPVLANPTIADPSIGHARTLAPTYMPTRCGTRNRTHIRMCRRACARTHTYGPTTHTRIITRLHGSCMQTGRAARRAGGSGRSLAPLFPTSSSASTWLPSAAFRLEPTRAHTYAQASKQTN